MSSKSITPIAEPATMFLGAGAVYLNYGEGSERLIGETKGGSTFTREVEITEIEGDGAYGKVKGHRIKNIVQPMLTIQALELSKQNIIDFIPGITSTDQTTYFELRESLCIPDSDYFVNVAFVGEDQACNNDLIIIVENALPDDNFELAFEKNEAVIAEVIFSAHYDRNAPTTVPYEIRYPVDDTTPPTVILSPLDSDIGVAISVNPTFTFNETMDVSTITDKGNIFIAFNDTVVDVPYSLTVNAAATIVTLIPDSVLSAATDYRITATTGCKDLAGNSLASKAEAIFTTA